MQLNRSLPSVSVLIPNFNHGHLIGDQLRAIFEQSVRPEKIVIVDDASTDNSVSVIRGLISGRANVELICKARNGGVIALINETLRELTTECITVLAADDIILPGFLEQSLTLLAQYPNASFCSAVSYTQSRAGDYVTPYRAAFPIHAPGYIKASRVLQLLMRSEDWFMGNTTVLRRAALLSEGSFDPALLSYCDGFMYRVMALRHGACFIPSVLAVNRVFGEGYSSSTTRDEHKLEQILVMTNRSMQSKFSNLFPKRLIARSNARMLFRLMCLRIDIYRDRILKNIEDTSPVFGETIISRYSGLTSKVAKVLLFCVLRIYDLPTVARSRLFREVPRMPKELE